MISEWEYAEWNIQKTMKGEGSLKIQFRDMKGEGIERAKLYLEKVIDYDLNTGGKPWSEILTLQKIRNSIIHNDGNSKSRVSDDGNFKRHVDANIIRMKKYKGKLPDKMLLTTDYLDYIPRV